jgi:hypothetical protein
MLFEHVCYGKKGYCMKIVLCFVLLLTSLASAGAMVDTFGIARFFPTKAGTREWNSAHWNNGIARTFTYAPDGYDPTGWTEDHSGGTDGFRIDGGGMMTMSGSGPRFHINSLIAAKVPSQKFVNLEFTAYYRRRGTQGANWGGMVVGARSGPLGHGSPGGNNCDATTYYGRFRNDGKWDFEKELKHSGSTYWSGSGFNTQDPLWHGATLPVNRWIGMKYCAINIENKTKVKLMLYIDSVLNGNPQNGGHWEKVGEVIDAGAWDAGDVSGCSYTSTMVITEGGGTLLLRTDNDTADYKMVSVREIDGSVGTIEPAFFQGTSLYRGVHLIHNASGFALSLDKPAVRETAFAIHDLQGRIRLRGMIGAGERAVSVGKISRGMYLVSVGAGQWKPVCVW